MESFAFGQCGLTPGQFYDMTPREFANLSKGFSDTIDRQYRAEWERARWIASVVIAPHIKKRMKPGDLISFPWEVKNAVKAFTRGEVFEAINKKFGGIIK